jgi:hypothetical protein
MTTVNVDTLDEQIIVHPTASRDHKGLHDIWTGEVHIFGKVIIEGKEYEFSKYVDVEFEKTKEG